MNHGNFQANELLALNTIREMPIFNAFGDMDFQRLLELMQQPVRAIDTCMGKEQLRTVAKQLLVQNLALQTRVRNHEIKAIGDAQHFEEAFDELDKAIAKHTDFDGLEQLMGREAEQQDAQDLKNGAEAQEQAATRMASLIETERSARVQGDREMASAIDSLKAGT